MNKKLFTLAAGLILGSAFTVANAQTEAPKGAKLDGSTLYFLGTDATHLLKAKQLTGSSDNTKKWTVFDDAAGQIPTDLTSEDAKLLMWKISVSEHNGTYEVKLINAKTEQALSFNDDGDKGEETKHSKTALTWGGMADTDEDGVPAEYFDDTDGSGNLDLKVVSKYLQVSSSGGWEMGDGSGTKAALKLFVANNDIQNAAKLNAILGNGFALSFPDVDPQPATNIFDQKLTAWNLDAVKAPVAGTYYAISTPTRGITNIDDFKASTFVAVSPVDHFGINALKQSNGVGFDFIAVSGRELVNGETEKDQVSVYNAIFKAYYADPVNKAGQYTLKLDKVYVKLDPKKDAQTKVENVYVDAITSVGVTYVTTTKDKNVQKLTASETNKVKAADILKTDAPAVFNIQFLSGKNNIAADGGSEYGKFLGLRQVTNSLTSTGVYQLFAEGSAYLNLDAPQNQWVITEVKGTDITFTSRENEAVKFVAGLRKTDTENVYELTSTDNSITLSWGYMGDAGYAEKAPATDLANLGTVKVKLVPAVIKPAAGIADFTKDELAKKAVIKFNVASQLTASELYVTLNDDNLNVTKVPYYATEWTLVKNTAATDSITDVLTYAYQATVDKKVVVKTDRMVDKAFVSYKLTTDVDGVTNYLKYDNSNSKYVITATKNEAAEFIIKENVNGTASLVIVGGDHAYNTTMAATAKALVYTGATPLVIGQNYAVVPNLTNSNPMPVIEITEPATSLEAISRHASFQGVNGGYIAVGAGNQAVIAAATEEAANLTFWLDTADVEEVTPSFYISQSPSVLKANAARNFLWNPADSAKYYNSSSASFVTNPEYYYNNDPYSYDELKAIFKEATLINADSLTTTAKGKLVEVDAENGLENFKFQILLADEAVEGEYVIRSVADGTFLSNLNGKLYLTDDASQALVVTLGEGDATANEAIAAVGVQVIGGKGAVTVQGAAGKVITVANVLGQTIANQVAASDNVTIAAPAGIVVVAVEGEATKVVVK